MRDCSSRKKQFLSLRSTDIYEKSSSPEETFKLSLLAPLLYLTDPENIKVLK